MKRAPATMCVTIIAVLAVTGSMTAQSPKPTKLESELRNVLRERLAAIARHDAKAFGDFLDDSIVIPDNGLLRDKKALVEWVRTSTEIYSEPRDVQVHGYNDTAVMLFRNTVRVPLAGQVLTIEQRNVETYVRRDGRWLLVALAENEIPNANRVPSKIDPAVLDAYVGEYQMSPGNILKITRHGDQIFEQWPGDAQPTPDFPLSESNFYQRGQPGVVSFIRSPDGKVDAYVLWLSDSTIVGKKIR